MDPDPDPRKEIEVDPDLDPERGLKWIRIRPNAVDPGGSGSGSETLIKTKSESYYFELFGCEFFQFRKTGIFTWKPCP